MSKSPLFVLSRDVVATCLKTAAKSVKAASKSSIAFLLIVAMISSMLLFAVPRHVSATRAKVEAPPVSAPPEPFLIHGPVTESSFIPMAAGLMEKAVTFFSGDEAEKEAEGFRPSAFGETGAFAPGFALPNATKISPIAAPAANAATTSALPPPPPPGGSTTFDFDGDGKADFSRWHAANTEYKILNSNGLSYTTYTMGAAGAKQAPADWDGDGKTDPAFFSSGTWTIRKSSTGTTQTITGFGQSGDMPFPGNYVGNGAIDAAVYRPSTYVWYFREAVNGTVTSVSWGQSGDIPVTGEYDGDGVTDVAVFRPSNGTWYFRGSTAGLFQISWGMSGDVPVPADYDGDGQTDLGIWRPDYGIWWVLLSGNGYTTYTYTGWGLYYDQPLPADYDGDGKADLAVWRPTTGMWWVYQSTGGVGFHSLGVLGDFAIPSAYIKQVGGEIQADDLAVAMLSPKNATGGTDLYSQNFAWNTSLVHLPGRSGLDLDMGLSYNSLIWTKVGSTMVFDPDYSNPSPGFRLGFPTIQPVYYDDTKSTYAYMMITPSGRRIEFRQTAVSNVYETADSSYAQLVTSGASNPNDPADNITIKVTSTDGTQMSYGWGFGQFNCTQIKDRNGNYISIAYNNGIYLDTITDTLGRQVKVNYDSNGMPSTITQTWKDNNGAGSNVTHTYATFTHTTKTLAYDFADTLSVYGPPSGTSINVLDKVTYADGSSTKFSYNGYAQVYKVENIAADSSSHVLNYVRTNLQSPSADQTDCPRFTETNSYVENFNGGNEVTFNNTAPTSGSYSLPGSLSGSASVVDTWMTGHPDNLRTKIYYGSSGWKEGLTLATEDCLTTTSTCSDRKRWTWTDWTQDNTSLTYNQNPRVTETRVGDSSNTKRTTIDYYQPTTGVFPYGLPETVQVYAADLSTVMKKSVTTYNLSSNYTDRRIIGLPSMVKAWGLNDQTSSLEYVSKVTFDYDGSSIANVTPTQHDGTNYGTGFTNRGNLTSTTRWDVTNDTNTSLAVTTSTAYNTAGSPVSQTDPRGRVTQIGYTDVWNDGVTRTTYAYPTTFTDPGSSTLGNTDHSSFVKYRYDIGANVEATSPAPAGNSYGKTSKRVFDAVGRLERNSIYVNTTEQSYVRYEFPTNGIQSQTYAPVVDADGDGNLSEDEVLTESWTDGAGRVRLARVPHTFNTDGTTATWAGTITEYDTLGRVARQSVPTEVNSSWAAAGDDATRGFLWTSQKYDWKGRVTRKINTDGDPNASDNDSDIFISYEGCGCAGGQVTTIEAEKIVTTDWNGNNPNILGRRKQKIYEDILGRQFKTETFSWDGTTIITSAVQTFDGRDQITRARQYDGSTSSSTYRDLLTTYDGHGRMATRHYPLEASGTNTTWTYNADDSINTVTDPRGVVTTFDYYSASGLLHSIAYDVPSGQSSEISDPGDVSFSYDNLGNRTSIADGVGSTNYTYNSLSQITSEIKAFTGVTPTFTINYTYNLSGALKSITDPRNSTRQATFDFDRVGRTVGAQIVQQGTTVFSVTDTKFGAWGGIKEVHHSGPWAPDVTYYEKAQYDTRLNISEYETGLLTSQNGKSVYDFERYADGNVKFDRDADKKFDRILKYDPLGRLTYAVSGKMANGDPNLLITDIPFDQYFSYNAFNELQSSHGRYWYHAVPYWTLVQYPQTTNAAGNVIQEKVTLSPAYYRYYKWDAAGRQSAVTDPPISTIANAMTTSSGYDGDGQLVKKVTSFGGQVSSTTFDIRSTVLGGEKIAGYDPNATTNVGSFTIPLYGNKMQFVTYVDNSTSGLFTWKPPESQGTFGNMDTRGAELDVSNPYDNGGDPGAGGYPGFEAPNDYARCTYQSLPVSCSLEAKFNEFDERVQRQETWAIFGNGTRKKLTDPNEIALAYDTLHRSREAQTASHTQKPTESATSSGPVSTASMPDSGQNRSGGPSDDATVLDSGNIATVDVQNPQDDPLKELLERMLASRSQIDQQNLLSNPPRTPVGGKISKRPLPLHPILAAYKNWLANGVSQDCKDALSKIGLWNKIVAGVDTLPVFDVNSIASAPASTYFGTNAPKGVSMGTFWKSSGAKTHRGSGIPGIYVQNGLWAFDPSTNPDRLYFLLHENAHFVQPISANLDIWLANRLGVKFSGNNAAASAALNDFFNIKHCKK